jgi:hypothetical protein
MLDMEGKHSLPPEPSLAKRAPGDVCYWQESGKYLLISSIYQFDPSETLAALNDKGLVSGSVPNTVLV